MRLVILSPHTIEVRAALLQEVKCITSITMRAIKGECVAVFEAFD